VICDRDNGGGRKEVRKRCIGKHVRCFVFGLRMRRHVERSNTTSD